MAVPKKKTSKAKKNMRRSHHALTGTGLTTCENVELQEDHTEYVFHVEITMVNKF